MLEFPQRQRIQVQITKVTQASQYSEGKETHVYLTQCGISEVQRQRKFLKLPELKPGHLRKSMYQACVIRLISSARRQWRNGVNVLGQDCFYSRIWQQAKLYKSEDKIKAFSDVQDPEHFLPHHLSQEVMREQSKTDRDVGN